MNVYASSRDDYFAQAGEREPALRELDALIIAAAPNLEPVLFEGMGSGVGLGYGLMDYQTKSMKEPRKWPLIALANQKNYMSLYVCAVDSDGQYLAEKHAERLGKVSCGKSCIRFKKIEDLQLSVVQEIISDVATRIARGEKLFGI